MIPDPVRGHFQLRTRFPWPEFDFPDDWTVELVHPFHGASFRFIVERQVSVYLDLHGFTGAALDYQGDRRAFWEISNGLSVRRVVLELERSESPARWWGDMREDDVVDVVDELLEEVSELS